MNTFQKNIEIRWADLDPNFHVLHSKYYDFGAYCRMAFLVENGLTPAMMMKQHFGPIIFREECIFKREIIFGDAVFINVKIDKVSLDFGRWTMIHKIYKNDETLAAIVTVDGAWMDTAVRKLTLPPSEVINLFGIAPKTDSFHITESRSKK
jgi:acyl-CoA thioester hydrolase